MKGFLIRAAEDVRAFEARPESPALYLCTNRTAAEYCSLNALHFISLLEDRIRAEYASINRWAFEQTFSLIERHRDAAESADFLEINFMSVKALFIQILKTVLVFDELRRNRGLTGICLRGADTLLGRTLSAYAEERGPFSVEFLKEAAEKEKAPPRSAKAWIYELLSHILNVHVQFSLRRLPPEGGRAVFASGALLHLAPVIKRLREKASTPVIFCENAFNLEKWFFCRRHKILFSVVSRPGKFEVPPIASFRPGEVSYGGVDWTVLFNRVFAPSLSGDLFGPHYDRDSVLRLDREGRVGSVLLDEDVSGRRLFAVLADRTSRPSFVVSHGVPVATITDEPVISPKYFSSTTFVNSPFEKFLFEGLYYKPSKLIPTGSPRYDQIFRARKRPSLSRPRKKVLFCTSLMIDWNFEDILTLMGCRDFMGDYTRIYLEDLLGIAGDQSEWTLLIKPHYNEEKSFEALIRGHAGAKNYELLSHKRGIFDLEAEADVILTVESSVICEAIMFEKPVIVLNYPPQSLTTPLYDKHGLVEHVKNVSQLRESIHKCLNDNAYLADLSLRRRRAFPQFAGIFDGRNTERVVSAIMEEAIPGTHTHTKRAAFA